MGFLSNLKTIYDWGDTRLPLSLPYETAKWLTDELEYNQTTDVSVARLFEGQFRGANLSKTWFWTLIQSIDNGKYSEIDLSGVDKLAEIVNEFNSAGYPNTDYYNQRTETNDIYGHMGEIAEYTTIELTEILEKIAEIEKTKTLTKTKEEKEKLKNAKTLLETYKKAKGF